MDKNKHVFFMRKLLRDFFNDPLLSSELRFKGGTAAMFFDGLPRMSTDLDFNLTNRERQVEVYERLVKIMSREGRIIDQANKHFGPLVVLDYGTGERNLKVEVSNRLYDNHYSLRNFGSMCIPVMERCDMVSHKLCAMLGRKAPRDVFDVWFFLSKGWPLNPIIIKERTGLSVEDFLKACKVSLMKVRASAMMMEIGELLDDPIKEFVRSGKIVAECSNLIDDYVFSPVLNKQDMTEHSSVLLNTPGLLSSLRKGNFDPSEISVDILKELVSGSVVVLRNKSGNSFPVRFMENLGIKF